MASPSFTPGLELLCSLPCTEVCDGTGSAWPVLGSFGPALGLMQETDWLGKRAMSPVWQQSLVMSAERSLLVLTGSAAMTALAKGTPLLSET